jgi:hypothetical protein
MNAYLSKQTQALRSDYDLNLQEKEMTPVAKKAVAETSDDGHPKKHMLRENYKYC